MATDLLKRLAEISEELERQNSVWERAKRKLAAAAVAALRAEVVPVPLGFFEELDALAYSPMPRPRGLRA